MIIFPDLNDHFPGLVNAHFSRAFSTPRNHFQTRSWSLSLPTSARFQWRLPRSLAVSPLHWQSPCDYTRPHGMLVRLKQYVKIKCLLFNHGLERMEIEQTENQTTNMQTSKSFVFQWLWMISIIVYLFILPEWLSVSRNLPREHSKGIKTEESSVLLRVLLLAAPTRCAQSGWPLGLGSLHYNRPLVSRLKFQDRICFLSQKHLPVNNHFSGLVNDHFSTHKCLFSRHKW